MAHPAMHSCSKKIVHLRSTYQACSGIRDLVAYNVKLLHGIGQDDYAFARHARLLCSVGVQACACTSHRYHVLANMCVMQWCLAMMR